MLQQNFLSDSSLSASKKKKYEKQRVIKDQGSQRSSGESTANPDAQMKPAYRSSDGYYSCRAKYNNKNKSLIICKKASSGHNPNNYSIKI